MHAVCVLLQTLILDVCNPKDEITAQLWDFDEVNTRAHTHKHAHTHIRTHIHTRTHTHTHAHK